MPSMAVSGKTDAELDAATIGPRAPLNGPIVLEPYDDAWPRQFAALAGIVRQALGARALTLEHVGSTSVPGLSAKPIIDMLLAVSDPADEVAYVPPLEARGFTLRIREPDWYQHRLFKTAPITGNLHVFAADCPEIERMLAFRDHLRRDRKDRRLYEATKHALAARIWKHTQNYADAKSDVVEEILSRALGARDRS